VILRDGAIWIKTFGGEKTVKNKDHASTAENSRDAPSDPMEATDEQEDVSDPLKKPFQDELQRTQRPNVPVNVQKPRMDPGSSRPSGNRPNMNRY